MLFWQLLFILLLILLNGFFAMSELALVASRKARLAARAAKGDARARRALELAERPGRFLSTIQIGITLVGILAGAIGGATVGEHLADWLRTFPSLAGVADPLAFGIVVLATTYLSVILGELVPKQVALRHPERIAAGVAGTMSLISRLGAPIVSLLEGSSNLVLRLMGVRRTAADAFSQEEVRILIAEGTKAGIFAPAEQDMMIGVMRFADRPARAFMTPRPDIEWLDLEDKPDEIKRQLLTIPYSRLPVGKGSLDEVVGIVQRNDLLNLFLAGKPFSLAAAMRPAAVVHDAASALKVLETLKQSPVHMALVVDEYGELEGLVTTTDVLEAIVGEFRDRGVESTLVHRREDGSWLIDGSLSTDQVQSVLGLPDLPTGQGFHTLAGFILSELEHLPSPGEHFVWNGYRFEVVDMDGRRIDKVLVSALKPESVGEGARA